MNVLRILRTSINMMISYEVKVDVPIYDGTYDSPHFCDLFADTNLFY